MPDPSKILAAVRRAATLFRATPGRAGAIDHLDSAEDVFVAGDLHGHVPTFRRMLLAAALDRNPARHLVLQELVHDVLADPDAGQPDLSHRLIPLVAALKGQYPDRVHLILGNHELSELTGRPIMKKGVPLNALFRRGVEADFQAAADEVMAAYHDLFRTLPLACRTPNRVLLCHTVPDERDLDGLDLEILRTGVWTPESLSRGGTVYALTWGRDTSPETAARFASLVDADLFITGHHPCDDGFQRANDRHLIVDGTLPSPAYCLFPARDPVTMDDLVARVRLLPGAS